MNLPFQKQFRAKIMPNLVGEPLEKPFTIREGNRWRKGLLAHCCTPQFEQPYQLFATYEVLEVVPIIIWPLNRNVWICDKEMFAEELSKTQIETLAKLDGFPNVDSFFDFFCIGKRKGKTIEPFQGQLIIFGKAGLEFVRTIIDL